jgi:hypothetical protein
MAQMEFEPFANYFLPIATGVCLIMAVLSWDCLLRRVPASREVRRGRPSMTEPGTTPVGGMTEMPLDFGDKVVRAVIESTLFYLAVLLILILSSVATVILVLLDWQYFGHPR